MLCQQNQLGRSLGLRLDLWEGQPTQSICILMILSLAESDACTHTRRVAETSDGYEPKLEVRSVDAG